MAYNFVKTSGQYLYPSSCPVTNVPLTIAAWSKCNDTATDYLGVRLSGGGHYYSLIYYGAAASDRVTAETQGEGGSYDSSQSASAYSANTWFHGAAVFSATNSRTAFLNGAGGTTNTTAITTSGISNAVIGGYENGGSRFAYMNGDMAEVGIWAAALTAAEIASLAKGMTCDKIRPQSLVFYAPLVRDLQDVRGGLAITNNNAATVATHPRVYA